MPRKRKTENKGYPPRWSKRRNAIYYSVPPGQEDKWDGKQLFRLGKTESAAYKEWAKRIEYSETAKTIGDLLTRYSLEVIPNKAAATREGHTRALTKIRAVFGHMPLAGIRPQHIYQYADKRGKKAAAKLEINLLSHAFTKAVEWGYIDGHPFKGEIRMEGTRSRTRYVEDWEIAEALKMPAPEEKGGAAMIQAYIELKLCLFIRQTDMLLLREENLKADGIHVTPSKTAKSSGKVLIFEWNDRLRRAVAKVRASRPLDISPWLFCNRFGECYLDLETGRAYGFASIWQRWMDRVLAETKVEVRFAERDLRAKGGSDADSDQEAQEMLGHTDSKTTRKFYRRKPTIIKGKE